MILDQSICVIFLPNFDIRRARNPDDIASWVPVGLGNGDGPMNYGEMK